MAQILVVDDEPDLLTLYELTLLRDGHNVQTAATRTQAQAKLQEHTFDLVLTDMRLPDGSGLDLLRHLATEGRNERSIVITAYGSAQNAVEALKYGAFDYLTKPVDLVEFRAAIKDALQALPAAPQRAVAPPTTPAPPAQPVPQTPGAEALARLVGDSAVMQEVKERIRRVAATMAPVLIHGESGTGKELVARALHACSHRHGGPFVPVNCSAIPENLLEAEFFGARKGAYTGAARDRDGFFQAAAGGTLFLDEIGDLPASMQAKLLRAIQERKIRPLGATDEQAVDVRFVSATHRDLAAEVAAGRFREDLYYRLNVIGVQVPPLRERREDIPAIADALLQRISQQAQIDAPALNATELAQLAQLPLKGNVRELENLLHRYLALGLSTLQAQVPVQPGSDPLPSTPPQPTPAPATEPAAPPQAPAQPPRSLAAWLDCQERRILTQHLDAAHHNLAAAAARLALSERQLQLRLQRLHLLHPDHVGTGSGPSANS